MVKLDIDRSINISVSVKADQYVWMNKNKFNKSKEFQEFLIKKMKKDGRNQKTSQAKTDIK